MALKKLFCLLIMVVAIVYLSQDKKLSVGKLEATNLHVPTPEFFFLDTTCGIPLTEYENRFLPFHLSVFCLAWNSIYDL